ncbi:sensor histidine kinase [Streptomyces lasiicapitis]|uniref:histidine kinase n=1 Tax=Streptomyces lasiicapitis TaxID=1923961 RepID=A0ABQ2MKI7_9ACTN|nr:sensor histidine kinase [Streptomyces lasiicapitis]GGO53664.1 two-component sensor histidine kinase [Streptomyces lasiicapitis]
MIADLRPWARGHPRMADATLTVALFGITAVSTAMDQPPRIAQWPPLPAAVIAAVSAAIFLAHRRFPRLTVTATTACSAALGAMGPWLGYEFGSTIAATAMAALYSLALRTDRRTAGRATAACVLALLAVSVIWAPDDTHLQPEQVGLVGFTLLSSAVADSTRSRRDYVIAVEARAELAERTREDEARLRVSAEQMRIARELHDVVAHHITLAHAQAATADYLLAAKPDTAQYVMRNLTTTLVSALNELRATVGLLREAGDATAPAEPAPGLARLPALLDSFEHAGLTVHLTCDGTRQPLSPGVDLTAYRIVQEALTNVTKHALTTTASVRLAYTGRLLTLTVSDDGQQQAQTRAAGYGLIGMGERAQAVGGRLRARPKSDAGFEVVAELPTDAPHSADVPLTAHEDKDNA